MTETLHDTVFPTATDCDLVTAQRMLREKYERFYPQVDYLMLNKGAITPHEGDVQDRSTQTPPATSFDDLWGEPIPSGMQQGTLNYEQPHTTALDATEGHKYLPAIPVNVHVNRNPTEKALSKFGLDEKKLLIFTFFVPIIVDLGIVIKNGDRFKWKVHMMEVKKWLREGYWHNTSTHLYIECACAFVRYGS